MRMTSAIFASIAGIVLLIGGLFASGPHLLEPSKLLTRLPPELAPWLLAAGGGLAVLGLLGLLGVFRPRHAH